MSTQAHPDTIPTLNPKQLAFVRHILRGKGKAESAKLAGYSERSAGSTASELLSNPKVKGEIERRRALIQQREIDLVAFERVDILNGMYTEAMRTGEGTSHGARVQAWTRLGQEMFGMWKDGKGSAQISAEKITVQIISNDTTLLSAGTTTIQSSESHKRLSEGEEQKPSDESWQAPE